MINAIRQKTVVEKGGRIEIVSSELLVGKTVEVLVLADAKEDATEYLLSSGKNREHLFQALEDLKNTANYIYMEPEDI